MLYLVSGSLVLLSLVKRRRRILLPGTAQCCSWYKPLAEGLEAMGFDVFVNAVTISESMTPHSEYSKDYLDLQDFDLCCS